MWLWLEKMNIDQEMSGRHSARHETIQIIRTAVIKKKDELRRTPSIVYRVNKMIELWFDLPIFFIGFSD